MTRVKTGNVVATILLLLVSAATALAEPTTRVVVYSGMGVTGSTDNAGLVFNPNRSISRGGNVLVSDQDGMLIEDQGVLSFLYHRDDPSPVPGEDYWSDVKHRGVITGTFPSGPGGVLYWEILMPSNDEVLVANNNGAEFVAGNTGEAAAGTANAFTEVAYVGSSRYMVMSAGGDLAYPARIDSGDTSNDDGIWHDDGTDNRQLVVRQSQAAPGLPGGSVITSLERPILAGPNTVVFNATTFITGIGSTTSIWRARRDNAGCAVISDCLELVIASGMPVPGIGGDSVMEFVDDAHVNSKGGMAYRATFKATQFGQQETGVFMSLGPGAPAMVYRSGTGFDAFRPNLRAFGDDGTLILQATGGDAELRTLFFGQLLPLIKAGDTVSGLPAGVTLTGNAQVVINVHGQIGLLARLQGPGVATGTNDALIAINGVGATPELAFLEGDTFEVAGTDCALRELNFTAGAGDNWSYNSVDGRPALISDAGEVLWWSSATGCISNGVVLVTDLGEPPPRPPALMGLEAVQSVQDWNNSVPLVKDKKTIVRAHFQLSEPATLSPRLRGFRNEAELPGGPLVPDNPGGRVPVSDNAALLRGSLNQVARFTLPKDWAHGDVVLEVDGGGQPVQCLEQSPPGTPDCQIEVSFESVAYPNIEFVDFKWTQGGTTHQVTKNQARELVRRMLAAYPIAHSNWGYKSLQWSAAWGLPPSKDRFGRVLAGLQTLRKRDNCSVAVGCNQLYYGVIRTNSLEGEADDIISSVAVGFVPSSPRAPGRQTHSHEVGHMLGLHHSVDGSQGLDDKGRKQGYCDEVADSLAPDFPWFFEIAGLKRPTLGPMDAGQQALVYGFDSDLGLIVDPEQDFDMMGYCANAPIDFWPSAHTYTTLRDNINLQFGELDQAVFRGPTGDYQLFRGLVDLDTMAVELLSTVVLEDVAPPDNPPAGDFTLRLRESGGAIIDEISFAVEPYQARGAQGAVGGFIIAVPFNAAINAFEIEHNSIVIASLSASDNAPTVSVVYPVGGETISSESIELQWTANDIDGDSLSFAVQYSDDNGASWNTIAEDRVQENLVIDRSQLPASGTALWRVGVSDGFLAGSDTSGTFTVSNNAPSIFVDDPAGGLLFSEGQSILFEASAIDPEDGPLDGSGFTWTSDIDGMLGSGNPLAVEVASLQDGEHIVTVSVEDSGALAGQDQVTIRVAQTAPAELSDLAVTWLDDGSFEEPGPVTVRAQVVNYGTESANNVTLQFDKLDGIPGEAIIGSVNPPPGWVCDGLSCSTTSLGLDQPAEFTLHLNLVFGNLLLSATAASDAVDPATGNNSAVMGVGLLPDFDQLLRSSFE